MANSEWIKYTNRKEYGTTDFNRTFGTDNIGLRNLSAYILDPGFVESLFVTPEEWITSITMYPFDVVGVSSETVAWNFLHIAAQAPNGGVQTDIHCKEVSDYTAIFDMGEVYIARHFNNYADFTGYTKIEVWLPFFGFTDIEVNQVMGRYMQIALSVDYKTGQAMYIIGVTDNHIERNVDNVEIPYLAGARIIFHSSFQLGYQIPIGSSNASDIYRNMLQGAVKLTATVGTAIATGGTAGALALGAGIFNVAETAINNMHTTGSASNSNNPVSLINCSETVKVVVYRPRLQEVDASYNRTYGKPLGEMRTLSALSGYTEVGEVHVDGIGSATSEELSEIERLLKSGVII